MKQIDFGPNDYRRSGQKEPIFLPGAGKIILSWVLWTIFALIVGTILLPVKDLGYWLSCTYVTGSCLPQ